MCSSSRLRAEPGLDSPLSVVSNRSSSGCSARSSSVRRKMYPKRRTTSGVARFGSRNGTKITGRTRGVRTTTLKRSSGSKK